MHTTVHQVHIIADHVLIQGASCIDSTIVQYAATGILLSGQRITVRTNFVIGTVAGDDACHNIDEYCLLATGDKGGNGDAPAGSRSIRFTGNSCTVNGDQAVHLRRLPPRFANRLEFLAVQGKVLLGLASNGLLSAISLIVGGVLIDAALRGGRVSSMITFVIGPLFLLSGLVNLAVLHTELNLLRSGCRM